MIYIILSLAIIASAYLAIRKVLSDKDSFEVPFPQRLENGIVVINLSDLSVLWVDTSPDDEVELIEEQPTEAVTECMIIENTDDSWFKEQAFLDYLIKRINENINLINGKYYDSFSFGETVYLSSIALWKYINEYGNTKEASNKAKREAIMLDIINELKSHSIASADIKDKYISAAYVITTDNTNITKRFIPLLSRHFKIERKKEGILKDITKIELKENEK